MDNSSYLNPWIHWIIHIRSTWKLFRAVSQRYHAIYCFSHSINDSVPLKTFQSPINNLHHRSSVSHGTFAVAYCFNTLMPGGIRARAHTHRHVRMATRPSWVRVNDLLLTGPQEQTVLKFESKYSKFPTKNVFEHIVCKILTILFRPLNVLSVKEISCKHEDSFAWQWQWQWQ